MKKFLVGLLAGAMVTGVTLWLSMPSLMLKVYPSRLGFEQTVAAIEQAYQKNGWRVPKVYNITKTLQSSGYTDIANINILSVCQPDDAYKILRDDANRPVTAVMPCRIGVYEAGDGRTYISVMNVGLMGKLFGGTIAAVMSDVAEKEHEILREIIAG